MHSLLKNNTIKVKKGQTLISLLVAIALFAILAHALFTLVSTSYSIVTFTRARVAARNLAQEKIEQIRNLPFNDVGTVGGIPNGIIPQTENVNRNGLNYTVKTSIIYIDDPFDGTAPIDLLPTDYKRVRIDVSWEGLAGSNKNPVTLISDVAPLGIETLEGGGTLSILVFDANAEPVGQADVSIIATDTSPQVNLSLQTGDNGRVILPGAPVCTTPCYQVTVSKDGYSMERTYSTSEVANPNKPHLSVLEGSLTEVSFAIDRVSTLDLSTYTDRESGFNPLANITFQIRGDKTIGTDATDSPVYKYVDVLTTDSNGNLIINDLEWDNYTISVDPSGGWDISGSNPLNPITILPDTNYSLSISLTNHTSNNLLTAFTDPANSPIASVSAALYDGALLVATASSGIVDTPDFGQVFFPNLESKLYDLIATASGYLDFSGTVDVAGSKTETVILNLE